MTTTYSDQVLEETPERATKLLNGIGALATVRTLLAGAGMADADLAEGRDLLLACLAKPNGASGAADTESAKRQREATAALDDWDEPNFARFEATLRRHFPSAADYVFDGLKASTGAASVTGVATFLARVTALEKGSDPKRGATKKDDKAAVELLAKRGLDKSERARLDGLVETSLGPTEPLPTGADDGKAAASRRAALVALKQWYDEWAMTAKAVVKKRGYLIRLGLATRKVTKKPPPAAS